jgi:ubiquinone/menaquinone biosynthesis C-methylase UbiE
MTDNYVHGYSEREAERLHDQAGSVKELFHHDTSYPVHSLVLEAGCGVGAQTVTLAGNSPEAQFVSLDINSDSLDKASRSIADCHFSNVQFCRADIFALPFDRATFDHLWVCHLLEHLSQPVEGLARLRDVLKSGGTITAVEGDHGSCYFHPQTDEAVRAWNCLIEVQARLGANSLVGRELFPLLSEAGFHDVHVSPRMVYMDRSTPDLMDAFVNRTIIPMVMGVKEQALEAGMMDEASWEKGIEDLYEVARRADGTFCYTFFKGTGMR